VNTCDFSPYITPSLTGGWVCLCRSRQLSHSRVCVPWDLWPYFTVSDSRLPQSGGPGPRIYIPQEQGGPVNPQVQGSLFVASYDPQGHGGGIRTRLHTGSLATCSISNTVSLLGNRLIHKAITALNDTKLANRTMFYNTVVISRKLIFHYNVL
jgi:hypothetical protein